MFKKNDYVLITDKNSPYFLQVGKIEYYLEEEDTIVVLFRGNDKYGGKDIVEMSYSSYELSITSKKLSFK